MTVPTAGLFFSKSWGEEAAEGKSGSTTVPASGYDLAIATNSGPIYFGQCRSHDGRAFRLLTVVGVACAKNKS